ncbi:MAG: NUDIX hydrolase, partial [Alphaproteobacteria bacterium]
DQPIVGVGVVVLKDDSVLLVQRGKPPRQGQWSLPGGAQELGETVFEAAHREVLEECGVTIGDPVLVDVVDAIDRDEEGLVRFHYTLVDVAAVWLDGDAVAGSDAAAVRWLALDKLVDCGLWAETVRVIELAARPR